MCLVCLQYQLGKMTKREAYTALRELTTFLPEEYANHQKELDKLVEEKEELNDELESYTD